MRTMLVDFNNLIIRTLFSRDVQDLDTGEVDWHMWKYRTINSLYWYMVRFKPTEVVLAVDGVESWRKFIFPRYKESRKAKRDEHPSNINWQEVFKNYDAFQEELKENLPVKIIKDKHAEADDVIGVLTIQNTERRKSTVIISADCDYLQLSSPMVELFNPLEKKTLSHPNPELFLVEMCFMGQKKDDIFNIKTPVDYPHGKRKPPFGEKQFEKALVYGWKKWLTEHKLWERYELNRTLLDFYRIPGDVKERIINQHISYKLPEPDGIIHYFVTKNWTSFIENISSVEDIFMQLY